MISNYDMVVNKIQFKGELEKQGRYSTWTWRCYWFVLSDDQLCYYKDEQCLCAQGLIDMSRVKHVRACKTVSHGYAFEICAVSRRHILSAVNELSRDHWMRQLQNSMFLRSHRRPNKAMITPSCNTISDAGSDNEDEISVRLAVPASPIPEESCGSEGSGRHSGRSVDSSRPSEGSGRRSGGGGAVEGRDSLDSVDCLLPVGRSSESLNNYLEFVYAEDEGGSVSCSVAGDSLRRGDAPRPLARSVSRQAPYADIPSRPLGSYPFAGSRGRCLGRGKSRVAREPSCLLGGGGDAMQNGFATAVVDDGHHLVQLPVLASRKTPLRSYYYGLDGSAAVVAIADNSDDDDDDDVFSSPTSPPTPLPDPRLLIGTPVPDLAFPRLELTWGSAADQIRSFLAAHRGSRELYATPIAGELGGRAVRRLVTFLRRLAEHDCQTTSL